MSNPQNAVSARNVLVALQRKGYVGRFGYASPVGASGAEVWACIKEALDLGDPDPESGNPTTEVVSAE